MGLSRTEINIRRLLAKCEFMVEENDDENDWRIEKFIEGLEDMILNLKREMDEREDGDHRSYDDALASYVKRKDFLKGYLKTKKITSPVSKVIAMQSLPKATSSGEVPKEIYQKVESRYISQVRDQLFDNSRSKLVSMKQNDFDSEISDQEKIQENIVGIMLDTVKNIKQRSVAANELIKKDILSAEKVSRIADVNEVQMKVNNETLSFHNKGAYKCWLWLMLSVAFLLFFYMIMFIKLFKKKS